MISTEHADDNRAEFFDGYDSGIPGDLDYYLDCARSCGGKVLEIGCGTGRVIAHLAQAGISVVGLDHSPPMLRVAAQRVAGLSPEAAARVTLVEADMREFAADTRFSAILIPSRGFCHMLTPADQKRTLLNIRRYLEKDGLFVFNVFDPRIDLIAGGAERQNTLVFVREFSHPTTGRRVMLWQSAEYNLPAQIIVYRRVHEELNDRGETVRRVITTSPLRFTFRHEMEHLLTTSGLTIEALHGHFDRRPYFYGSEQIWNCRLAAASGTDPISWTPHSP